MPYSLRWRKVFRYAGVIPTNNSVMSEVSKATTKQIIVLKSHSPFFVLWISS
jgi:hypothetical protein